MLSSLVFTGRQSIASRRLSYFSRSSLWLTIAALFVVYLLFTAQVYVKYHSDPDYMMGRSFLFNALQVLTFAAAVPPFLWLRNWFASKMHMTPILLFSFLSIGTIVTYALTMSVITYGFGFNTIMFSGRFLGKYFTSLALVHLIFLALVWLVENKKPRASPGIWLEDRGQKILKSVADIIWIEALDHYVKVQTPQKSYLKKSSMKGLQTILEGQGFLRIHRSYWINQAAIQEYTRVNGRLFISMKDGRQLPIGKTYQKTILPQLAIHE